MRFDLDVGKLGDTGTSELEALRDNQADVAKAWTDALAGMGYDDPLWRELMDLEGLKRGLPADPAVLKRCDVVFAATNQYPRLERVAGWYASATPT